MIASPSSEFDDLLPLEGAKVLFGPTLGFQQGGVS